VVVVALLATTLFVAAGSPASGATPCAAGEAVYVNTFARPVDVYVGGTLTFRGLRPGGAAGTFAYSPSPFEDCRLRQRLQLFPAVAGPPDDAPATGALLDARFGIRTAEHADVVPTVTLTGVRTLRKFPTNIAPHPNGASFLTVRHTANRGPVDVWVDGSRRRTNVVNGTQFRAFISSFQPQHEIRVTTPGTTTNVVPPIILRTRPGANHGIYLVSSLSGTGVRARLSIAPTPSGYRLVEANGAVYAYGTASAVGSAAGLPLAAPIVGGAATATGNGYWLVAADGGVFNYGDARFFGSAGALPLVAPIVALQATPTNRGYWLFAADGGVFSYGDARFFGSAGALRLTAPIVAAAAVPDGSGYLLLGRDGGVFTYGAAQFQGAMTRCRDAEAITVPVSPLDYWALCRDRGFAQLGRTRDFVPLVVDAVTGGEPVSMLATPLGLGLVVLYDNGAVRTYGQALRYGDIAGAPGLGSMVAVLP
jgi:hypothetical protein